MKSVLVTTGSDKDLKLLFELSKKIGLKSKLLTEEQVDELCLVNAIKNKEVEIIRFLYRKDVYKYFP